RSWLAAGPSLHRVNCLSAHAIWISHLEARLVFGVRLQVENTSREHLGRCVVEAELLAEDSFATQSEQGHSLFPIILASSAISDVDDGVAVVVARDLPLETKADQRRTLYRELAWAHGIDSLKH